MTHVRAVLTIPRALTARKKLAKHSNRQHLAPDALSQVMAEQCMPYL